MSTAHIQGRAGIDCFINLVTFKWLMAGIGWWIDLPRLQSDRAYMEACLQRALTSDSELLQKRSAELLGLQGGSQAQCHAATPSPDILSASQTRSSL